MGARRADGVSQNWEQCVIKDEHFFVRGRLVIPVADAAPGTEFDWGVWLSTELPLYQPLAGVQEIAEMLLHGLPAPRSRPSAVTGRCLSRACRLRRSASGRCRPGPHVSSHDQSW